VLTCENVSRIKILVLIFQIQPTVVHKPKFGGSSFSAPRKNDHRQEAAHATLQKKTFQVTDSTAEEHPKVKANRKRSESSKRQSDAVGPEQKRPKFSSLFTNNPEIPRVKRFGIVLL